MQAEDMTQYKKALNFYWNKSHAKAINALSEGILLDDESSKAPYYRLWIEILADKKSFRSLAMLKEHFLQMNQTGPFSTTWTALRGLIHLELDEVEALDLTYKALKIDTRNPYVLEFKDRYHLRTEADLDSAPLLQKTEYNGRDYFLWQTLAQLQLVRSDFYELETTLMRASAVFPTAPMPLEFDSYKQLDRDRLGKARLGFEHLSQLYPDNFHYLFMKGYCELCMKDYSASIRSFEYLLKNRKDLDAKALLALSLDQEMNDRHTGKLSQRAQMLFLSCLEERRRKNLPTDDIQSYFDASRMSPALENSSSHWLLHLSPRRYEEFASAPENSVASLSLPLSPKARAGDLLFVTSDAPFTESFEAARLVGVFTVKSDSVPSPIDGYSCTLDLVSRYQFPVPLEDFDFQFLAGYTKQQARRVSDGCFLLDKRHLEKLTAQLQGNLATQERAEDLSLNLTRKVG